MSTKKRLYFALTDGVLTSPSAITAEGVILQIAFAGNVPACCVSPHDPYCKYGNLPSLGSVLLGKSML